jgi:hypothetical protein
MHNVHSQLVQQKLSLGALVIVSGTTVVIGDFPAFSGMIV